MVNDRVPLFIDLKSGIFNRKVFIRELVKATRDYKGRIVFMSFDPRELKILRNETGRPIILHCAAPITNKNMFYKIYQKIYNLSFPDALCFCIDDCNLPYLSRFTHNVIFG
jgi:glycerophosphoryl diester phosphodiesterase